MQYQTFANSLSVRLFLLILLFGSYQNVYAGVTVGGTRLIFNGNQKEASLSVSSEANDKLPYLIQSFVDNAGPKGDHPTDESLPFIVTPPLFRLEPGQENVLRIIRAASNLPEDRESIYWMNVKAIPANDQKDEGVNVLRLSVKNRIKLFYRPAALVKQPEDVFKQTSFKRSGNTLVVTNPSVYYLTFHTLKVGGQTVDTDYVMVPPKGYAQYPLPASASGKISWKYINDYGAVSGEKMGAISD